MDDQVEILVHLSAPSQPEDDRRYRKQAQGWLDFLTTQNQVQKDGRGKYDERAKHRPRLSRKLSVEAVTRGDDGMHLEAGPQQEAQLAPQHSDKLSSDVPSEFGFVEDSLSQAFQGQCARFPRAQTEPLPSSINGKQDSQHRRSQSDSFDTPPSVVPDSQPSQSSLRKRLLDPSSSFLAEMLLASAVGKQRTSPAFSNRRQSNLSAVMHLGAANGKRRPNTLDRELQGASCTSLPTSPSDEVTAKATTLMSVPPTSIDKPSSAACRPGRVIHIIRPAPPPTGESAFSAHAASGLDLLASTASLASCYQPASIKRATEPLERGFWSWRIDNSIWTAEQATKFWSFVTQFVNDGYAGWGTWIERELEPHCEQLRVWCWAELIREVWLMLFVGSKRLIKGAGATWVDAQGHVVVQME